MQRESG